MFCTRCGAPLDGSARFCTACGYPVARPDAPPHPQTGGPPPPPRKLRRIVSQKKIAGVCAGFAEYFDTDVTLMRVISVVLALVPPHLGLIGYIIAWIVLPKS